MSDTPENQENLNPEPSVTIEPTQPVVANQSEVDVDYASEPVEEVQPEPFKGSVFFQEKSLMIEGNWDQNAETVSLPSGAKGEVLKALTKAPNIALNDSEKSREWADTLNEGLGNAAYQDNFKGTLENEEAYFEQSVKSEVGPLGGGAPAFKPIDGETVKGQRGILRMMSYLGMGTVFKTPLWHTGIWITIKAPSEAELLELQRQLAADKIDLGRNTYGLAFSSTSVYIADRLVSFALRHIYETTLSADVDLKTVISVHDIPALLWGLTNAIYPRGFQYRRACIADAEKCNHVIEERLNLSKILWTNTKALTPSQVLHMTKRQSGSVTIDAVNRYKEEMLATQKRRVTIDEGSARPLNMTLRVPTVAEYIDSGQEWISSIVTMVNNALGLDASENERNEYIFKHGQATSMRQQLHWVESIEFGGNVIDDNETLRGTFNVLSTDDITRNDFMKKVQTYIDDTAIALLGIPVYDCPSCGKTQPTPLPKQTSIIPIDVYQTFFTLLAQKLQRLTVR
jgi:hypothetical protein